jgi:hypothetical protein
LSRKTRSSLGQKPRKDMVGVRSQKLQLLEVIREKKSMTREKLNVTVVRSLVTSLQIVGQTRRGNQKKRI